MRHCFLSAFGILSDLSWWPVQRPFYLMTWFCGKNWVGKRAYCTERVFFNDEREMFFAKKTKQNIVYVSLVTRFPRSCLIFYVSKVLHENGLFLMLIGIFQKKIAKGGSQPSIIYITITKRSFNTHKQITRIKFEYASNCWKRSL